MTTLSKCCAGALLTTAFLGAAASSYAVTLDNSLGGPRGYGTQALAREDPGEDDTAFIAFNSPFPMNFFGTTYNQIFVNGNGNITFGGEMPVYFRQAFPFADRPTIAPFLGDVDTRQAIATDSNQVYVASPNADTIVVTWDQVGYFDRHVDKLNDVQLVLTKSATAEGDFDVEFRYGALNWAIADQADNTAAQAGFDAGDGVNFLSLPGSRTDQVLSLATGSNVSATSPGQWRYKIRGGQFPGLSASNPLTPIPNAPGTPLPGTLPPDTVPPGTTFIDVPGFHYVFPGRQDQFSYIDPEIAIGYDYILNSGPNFRTVQLPPVGTDSSFDLYLWDGTKWVFSQALAANLEFDFGAAGVNRFRILGIDTAANLSAGNAAGFTTALKFVSNATVDMNKNPIAVSTPATRSGGGGGGGCAMTGRGPIDPTLLLLPLLAIAGVARRARGAF